MDKKLMLSENDKKKTIAAKKKPKLILKNLLVQPFEKYWPELTVADAEHFVNIFRIEYNLSSSSNTLTSTPVTSYQTDNNVPSGFGNKLNVGLQSSIRSISSGQRLALFISTKIKPKHIVDQIIIMILTHNKKSKIFCFPNMDEAMYQVFGFSCQCLAILENTSEIWNWILEKSEKFPVPPHYFFQNVTKTEQMDVDCSKSSEMDKFKDAKVDFSKLYLLKTNANERAFIPNGTVRKNLDNDGGASGFISLGETNQNISNIIPTKQMIRKMKKMGKPNHKAYSKLENLRLPGFTQQKKNYNQISHTNKVNYVSLKINKVLPNPDKNRIKKKKNKK